MKRAVGGYDSNLFQGTQCQRIVVCTAAAAAAASASGAVYLRAGLYCCVRCCLCLSPFAACGAATACDEFSCARGCLCPSPLWRARSFDARGAACASAVCGARAVCEEFCYARGAACVSTRCRVRCCMPRALLMLCAREFCCARCCCCARGVLLRAGLLVFERVAACTATAACEGAVCNQRASEGAQHSAQGATRAGVLFICTKRRFPIAISH